MNQRALAVWVIRGVSFESLNGAGDLSAKKLHAADAEHGQHGDGKDDDAHAAQPLELLAVQQDGSGQVV